MDIVRLINVYVISVYLVLVKKKKILVWVVNLGIFYKVYFFYEMV